MQYSTVQYSTVQYSTVQYSLVTRDTVCSLLSIDTLSLGRKGSRQSVASLGSGLGIEDETDQDCDIPAASPAREAEARDYEEYEPVPAAAKKTGKYFLSFLHKSRSCKHISAAGVETQDLDYDEPCPVATTTTTTSYREESSSSRSHIQSRGGGGGGGADSDSD